jgi:hypothetical protein
LRNSRIRNSIIPKSKDLSQSFPAFRGRRDSGGKLRHGPATKMAGKLTQNDTECCAQELIGPFKRETADVFAIEPQSTQRKPRRRSSSALKREGGNNALSIGSPAMRGLLSGLICVDLC